VAPGNPRVIPLEPEFITPQDGKVVYKNAFATNHRITEANVADIVRDGRARWKVENENNNTLKTKGYHLTHNFGHGKHYLSSLLATFNLLAFLFHTVLDRMDSRYRRLRQFLSRKRFFNDLQDRISRLALFASSFFPVNPPAARRCR
jgi:hypothetical protein